ncbi:MAG: hypothetical protein HY553_18385 [Elusimicrobia bacterium]|nr:hypothetical protein [Elusimicrobiota bacterium]
MTGLLLALLLPSFALGQPDMSRQGAWTEKEKKEFLEYLRSGGQAAPKGQAKEIPMPEAPSAAGPRKPFFVSLAFTTDTPVTLAGNAAVRREGTGLGPKLLAGGHVFTWLRYYAGVSGNRFRLQKLDGTKPLVTHLQIPAGFEIALVPLGTPHTQYLLLRGGAALHRFSSSTPAAQFVTPLDGWQGTVNAGIGYEWQIHDSGWRVHALLEGYKDVVRQSPTARFYGLGFTLGTVYTF